eukprot:34475-Heterocapsa_arctica.AAC.1
MARRASRVARPSRSCAPSAASRRPHCVGRHTDTHWQADRHADRQGMTGQGSRAGQGRAVEHLV